MVDKNLINNIYNKKFSNFKNKLLLNIPISRKKYNEIKNRAFNDVTSNVFVDDNSLPFNNSQYNLIYINNYLYPSDFVFLNDITDDILRRRELNQIKIIKFYEIRNFLNYLNSVVFEKFNSFMNFYYELREEDFSYGNFNKK